MLGQLQVAVPQQLGAVDDRMHQQVLGGAEAADLVPAKHLIPGKYIAVIHDPLGVGLGVLVDIVADHHVHQLVIPDKLAQLVQGLAEGGTSTQSSESTTL